MISQQQLNRITLTDKHIHKILYSDLTYLFKWPFNTLFIFLQAKFRITVIKNQSRKMQNFKNDILIVCKLINWTLTLYVYKLTSPCVAQRNLREKKVGVMWKKFGFLIQMKRLSDTKHRKLYRMNKTHKGPNVWHFG